MKQMRLSRSILGQLEADAVSRVILNDGYLGMGEEVKKFESELSNYIGVSDDNVVCVSSGTAALHLGVQSILKPGDEILVQSLTYVASFQAIGAAGAVPVPCEVIPETLTIDLSDAEKKLNKKTRAIMPVHYASNPGELEKVYAFAEKNKLRVIEDAAHGFGCTYKGNKIGSFGDIVCFSFDGIKNITSGEGGALVTSDKEVISYVKDARLLGVEKDTQKRFSGQRSWEFDVRIQGYRYHMSNIMAAVGRIQLARLEPEFGPKRKALAGIYRNQLSTCSGIEFFNTHLAEIIPHIQPVRVLHGKRDELRHYLEKKGIGTGIHYKPNHMLTLYGKGHLHLPVTEKLYKELITLPLHPGLEHDDVMFVCERIHAFLSASK